MTDNYLNEMYLIAIKAKLERNAISIEEKCKTIFEEINIDKNKEGDVNGITQTVQSPNVHEDQTPPPIPSSIESDGKTLEVTGEKKYAQCPEEDGFLNRDLETSDDGQFYLIERTNDPDRAFFSLITNNRTAKELTMTPTFAPDFAIEFENSRNGQENLSVVSKGILKKDGVCWKIVERCKLKWT